MPHISAATDYACLSAHSTHVEPMMAAEAVAEHFASDLGAVDLLLVFASGRHAHSMGEISSLLRRELDPGVSLCVTGEGVLADTFEIEAKGAVSALALSLPGTRLHPFRYQDLHADASLSDVEAARAAIRHESDLRALLFFVDPFSVPASSVVHTLAEAACVDTAPRESRYRPLIGGMASASSAPGGNIITLNGEVMRAGGAGVAISGDVRVDTIVSQGCRPIGQAHVITEGERNLIRKLGGRKAMDVLRETVEAASRRERELLENGVLIGRVVNEYRDRFGRGDFLVRGIMGLDPGTGAVAIGDSVRVGQTVQFHIRDEETASEDLSLLLDAEQVRDPALGILAVSCNGRGSRLFKAPNHDASLLSSRVPHATPLRHTPLAGLFAAGEFGPIGGQSFVHGHTACAALFRRP